MSNPRDIESKESLFKSSNRISQQLQCLQLQHQQDASSLDALLASLGLCRGFYPMGVYLLHFPIVMVLCWQMMILNFSGWAPEVRCLDSNLTTPTRTPRVVLDNIPSNSCQVAEFTADAIDGEATFVVEWSLVFSDSDLVNWTNSCFMIGMLLSNLFLGRLPDIFGRKPVLFGSLVLLGALSLFAELVQSIYQMMVIRFFAGVFYVTGGFAVFMYMAELFASKHRAIATQCITIAWSMGLVSLSLLAYLIPKWRNLHVAVGVSSVVLLPIYFFVPESIVFLASRKRFSEIQSLIEMIKKKKKVLTTLGEPMNKTLIRKMTKRESMETSEPLQQPQLERQMDATYLMNLLVLTFYWLVDGLIYFALQFSTQQFSGNRFFNFFLFGIVEIPALLIAALINQFTTRRFTLFLLHFVGGFSMMSLACIRFCFPHLLNLHPDLPLAFNLIVKFCVAGGLSLLNLVNMEVYPTPLRAFSYNINASGSRVAGIAAMFLPLVVRAAGTPAGLELAFGILGLLASVSTVWLVESSGHPIPQTMEDVRKMKKETKNIFKLC